MWDGEKTPLCTYGMFMTFMTVAREPKTQIAGVTLLGQMSGMGRGNIPSNVTDLKFYAAVQKVRKSGGF